jgi:hypothetical protein
MGSTGSPDESISQLAPVTRLVQYCINTCSAVDAAQRTIPLLGRMVASQRNKILEEKAGQARDIDPLAGQVSGKMIASGWRTAPPQISNFEVVLATNSACQHPLEASPRVPEFPCAAPSALSHSALTAELFQHLAPVIESRSRASASRPLSAPR